uniref:ATP-dependent DNA helicase n=1 Tax=Schistosoma curassoni TaxID=6186 RepID=A0A183KU52_9TREM
LPDNGQSIKCTLGKECHVYHFVVSLFNRYNHKTVGYFTAVDLSEVIQNSLIDDDHLNVINNREMNQSLNQPYLSDRVVPINLLDGYITTNRILHGQQSTLHETFCCEYKIRQMSNKVHSSMELDLWSFTLLRADRIHKRKGEGVALFIKNATPFAIIDSVSHEIEMRELVSCRFKCKRQELLIGLVYLSPSCDVNEVLPISPNT